MSINFLKFIKISAKMYPGVYTNGQLNKKLFFYNCTGIKHSIVIFN